MGMIVGTRGCGKTLEYLCALCLKYDDYPHKHTEEEILAKIREGESFQRLQSRHH